MPEALVSPKKQKTSKNKANKGANGSKRRRESNAVAAEVETPQSKSAKKKRKSRGANETDTAKPSVTSPFATCTSSFYLPVSPIGQRTPLETVCAEYLSPLILTHFPPLQGVVLSYSNARFMDRPSSKAESNVPVLAKAIDEYAFTYAWVTADFLVLTSSRNTEIEGYVNVQSENHLGLICWNLFNASVERRRLPRSWKWMGGSIRNQNSTNEEGYYLDEDGTKIDGAVTFRIKDFESVPSHGKDNGFMSIEGTMLSEEEDMQLDKHRYSGAQDGEHSQRDLR